MHYGTEKWGEGFCPSGMVGNEALNEVGVIVPHEHYLSPIYFALIHLQAQEHEARRHLRALDDRHCHRHRMIYYVDGRSDGGSANDYRESKGNVTEDTGNYQTN